MAHVLLERSTFDRETPLPVILGAGLTGSAISRALSAAGITHALIGEQPTDLPRLGESLNAEGSLEALRQFPDLMRWFFDKRQMALFYGEHAVSFDTIQLAAGRAYDLAFGYPSTVRLLHVDRIGFDRALFQAATADDHCWYLEDRATAVDYRPQADRIDGVQLASGQDLRASYVFDATNSVGFLARRLGVRRQAIGEPRRVVFAHYRGDAAAAHAPAPWMQATTLLRLDARDPVDGLAWCIPLGDYVSVGISVDPARTSAGAPLLLDWAEKAYAARGLDVPGRFPQRGAPVDIRYEHYTHERCYGRNWLLAGPSCCQVWFPAGSGVATALIAARLAADAVRAPARTGALYQSTMDEVAASHAGLEWLVREDPGSLAIADLRSRTGKMAVGNARRLAGYVGLQHTPNELAYGDAMLRMFQSDRLLASPIRIAAGPPCSQAARLFAPSDGAD